MKKLLAKYLPGALIVCALMVVFLPKLALQRIPFPGDALLGLYHPWRDIALQGFTSEHFPVKNPLITDPLLQTFPWRYLSVDNIKALHLPLWNPYSFLGQPLLGNLQSGNFQILNLFFLVLPFKEGWAGQIILPLILCSLFMYFFLSSLNLSRPAAIYGALVLPFSGFFISWAQWGTVITTAMWFPLILFLINKNFNRIETKYFLVLVFSVFQALVSGHFQTSIYLLCASALYTIYKTLQTKNRKSCLFVFVGFLLAFLISAPQLFPTIEFSSLSNRGVDQNFFTGRTDWFLPIKQIIQIISPDFFGNPTTYNYWGIWNYGEFISYIGIVPLFFAIYSFLKFEKKYTFFLILLTCSILLAIENPLSKIPYSLNLPIISSFQPSRIIFLIDFCLVVFSAIGMNKFINSKKLKEKYFGLAPIIITIVLLISVLLLHPQFFTENKQNIQIALKNLIIPIFISISLLLTVLISTKVNKKITISIFFILTAFELLRFWNKFTPFTSVSAIYPGTQTTHYLQSQAKPFRILSTDRRIMAPNSSTMYKLESVSGYDPLYLKDYARFVSAWQSGQANESPQFNRIITPEKYNSPITDMLNVKYILTFDDINKPGYIKVFEEGKTKVYENQNSSQRAYFATSIIKKLTQKDVLESILASDQLATKAYSTDLEFSEGDPNAKLNITGYQDQELSFNVEAQKKTPLVVTTPDYPGWRAYVDKVEVPIKKVNYMFQAIIVPAGNHSVQFKFNPNSFTYGLITAVFGILATLITSLYLWRKEYQS